MVWLSFTGLAQLTNYLFTEGLFVDYPSLVAIGFSLPLAQGPSLYLYTKQQTSVKPFDKKLLLHYLPMVASMLMFLPFHFLDFSEKVKVFEHAGSGYQLRLIINLGLIYVSGVIYVFLALQVLLRYRKGIVHQFSNTEKINFNWLLYLIIWIAAIWIVILFMSSSELIYTSVALFVLWLGFFGVRQVNVFAHNTPMTRNQSTASTQIMSEENQNIQTEIFDVVDQEVDEIILESTKYQKSSLSEKDADDIHSRLKKIMEEKKPHTNPDLTLTELARSLNVHPNHLSQVINSKENKTFYDLINEKRVEEFINTVSKPDSKQFTLLALAFDCGFNSKASFNRNFKKHTGLTPSDYLKRNSIN